MDTTTAAEILSQASAVTSATVANETRKFAPTNVTNGEFKYKQYQTKYICIL